MKVPTPKKLQPLADKFIKDHGGYRIYASGKISNQKKGVYNITWQSAYDLGLTLYRGGMIKRRGSNYYFVDCFCGMGYPYRR